MLDVFPPVFLLCIANSHFIGIMVNSMFSVIDEVIRVSAMPEFVHQVCVRLISSGGAHKHSFTLKSLSILNMDPITTFLLTSLSTFLKCKIEKTFKEVNEIVKKKFFPNMSAS